MVYPKQSLCFVNFTLLSYWAGFIFRAAHNWELVFEFYPLLFSEKVWNITVEFWEKKLSNNTPLKGQRNAQKVYTFSQLFHYCSKVFTMLWVKDCLLVPSISFQVLIPTFKCCSALSPVTPFMIIECSLRENKAIGPSKMISLKDVKIKSALIIFAVIFEPVWYFQEASSCSMLANH